ncbi:hypothetical protein U1707_17265 [Sphingomonas sp. PB2P12]|uniref:hypothetical protein n=1 Tax=Sphingomonas sandaracina TaxID=3096157 RepID=UPI002FC5C70A
MVRNLEEPAIELGQDGAYEVLVRLGDLRDRQAASLSISTDVYGQARQRFADIKSG